MNPLETYANSPIGRPLHKWPHYFDIYHRHFERFRNKGAVVLEVGVGYGGSLQMWKAYFGDRAQIFGVDRASYCKAYEEDGIKVFIGCQADRGFLGTLKEQVPPLDVLIGDGEHKTISQVTTFEELFDHIKEGGVYLCEDVHGGPDNFMEHCKRFVGALGTVGSIHFYNGKKEGVVVIEKPSRPLLGSLWYKVPTNGVVLTTWINI